MSEPHTGRSRDWVYVGVLTVLGLLFLWWAGEQLTDVLRVTASEFRPPRLDLLLYLLTLIAAGVLFGLASTSGDGPDPGRRKAIALWSILPLLGIVGFYSLRGFGWPPGPWLNVNVIVVLTNIHVGSSLAFGFFVSKLVTDSRPAARE